MFSVVGSTPKTWSSKFMAAVKTSAFGAEFTVLNNYVEESVIIRYHLRLMVIEVSKPKPTFVDIMSVVSNVTNTCITLKKKTMELTYHF